MTLAGWRWKVRDGSATPAALDAADAARKPKIRSRGVFPRFVCTRIYRLARDHPIPLASSTYKGAHSTPPLMSLGRGRSPAREFDSDGHIRPIFFFPLTSTLPISRRPPASAGAENRSRP